MGKTFGAVRGTWAAVGVVVLGGCSTILDMDHLYELEGVNESGSSSSSSGSGTGGSATSSGTGGSACVLVDDKNLCTTDECIDGVPVNTPVVGKKCNLEGQCNAKGACVTPCLGTLGFVASPPVPVGKNPGGVTLADFDKDGKLDLAVVNEDDETVSFLHGHGDGTFAAAVPTFLGGYPVSIAAADLDVDGNVDLVLANLATGKVDVLWGHGDGDFEPPSSFPTGASKDAGPDSVAIADLNGDGLPDLAVANNNNGTVGVLLGATHRQFAPAITYASDQQPHAVVALDLDGDGIPDLASANGASSTVRVLHGDGKGKFVSANQLDQIYSPSAMTALDLDGDDKPDLIVANALQDLTIDNPKINTVSVLFNTGNGNFGPKVIFEVGSGLETNPSAVVAVDLDGTGKPDLAVANAASNTVSVLLATGIGPGNDTKAFALKLSPKTGAGPDSIVTADVNGDGRPDLVTANGSDNTVSILLNTCTD
jgi:hypothetical protein